MSSFLLISINIIGYSFKWFHDHQYEWNFNGQLRLTSQILITKNNRDVQVTDTWTSLYKDFYKRIQI